MFPLVTCHHIEDLVIHKLKDISLTKRVELVSHLYTEVATEIKITFDINMNVKDNVEVSCTRQLSQSLCVIDLAFLI